MTAQTFRDYLRSRKENGVVKTGSVRSPIFWRNFRINEWTFSLFLFVLSLGIVAGKLYINYGSGTRWPITMDKNVHILPTFAHMYDVFAVPNFRQSASFHEGNLKAAREKLVNVSREYGDAMAGAVAGMTSKYGWLLRAAIGGIAMMGFTWFIIYKDSSIPGVNPPSPFSPRKQRYEEKSRLQINYLIGVLNGVLIFVYMCL